MSDNHDPHRLEQKQARLTAYALGQLDASECGAVEVELAISPEAREFVDEIRTLADHVHETARREPLPPPSPTLRDKLCTRLNELEDRPMNSDDIRPAFSKQTNAEQTGSRRRRWVPWVAAACVLLLVTGSLALVDPDWFSMSDHSVRNLANWDDGYSDSGRAGRWSGAAAPADELSQLGWGEPSESPEQESGEAIEKRRAYADVNSAPSIEDIDIDSPLVDAGPRSSPGNGSGPGNLGRRTDDGGDIMHQPVVGDYAASPQPTPPSQTRTEGSGSTEPPRIEEGLAYRTNRGPRDHFDTTPPGRPAQPEGEPAGEPADTPRDAPAEQPPMERADVAGSVTGGAPGEEPIATPPPPRNPPTAEPEAVAINNQPVPKRQDPFSGTASGDKLARVDPDGRYQRPQPRHLPDTPTPGNETYDKIFENDFLTVGDKPRSTFSIDVDTASYANVRRFLREGRLPPADAVRIEEMVNYFQYRYPPPEDETPFAVQMEVTECPWRTGNRLLKVGLKGREIDREQRGLSNLVFLLDVSGSMSSQDKLPLVKQAMRLLVEQLTEDDRVAIVTYASNAGLRLESTCGEHQHEILKAIDGLGAGGSTHGSAGIQMAYEQAAQHFLSEGVNRVILCTDGDLNVGITRDDDLVRFIEDKARTGVFLTVLGFGTGNLKDAKMEKLADKGNGTYAYIDTLREARKVLVEQMTGSLITIAKDVKIQIEFNPAEVMAYRLIGYENRVMAARDFDDDRKDAGEIGAGHTVTALYELVPEGSEHPAAGERPLKYQRVPEGNLTDAARSGELLTLRLRYKEPDGAQSQLLELSVKDQGLRFGQASPDFQFAAAVAASGMLLRGSKYAGEATLAAVEEYAVSGLGDDPQGYRAEFVDLIRQARQLSPR